MIKSNSKAAITKIRAYILEGFQDYFSEEKGYFSGDLERLNDTNPEDLKEVCNAILTVFWAEEIKYNSRAKRVSRFDLFRDWVMGLCSAVNSSFCYNTSAVSLLGDWLEETEEEKNKYSECEAVEMIIKLLWREITKNATRTGVLY